MNHATVRREFLQSEEGRIFVIGCLMLMAWVGAAAILWRTENRWWNDVLTLGFAHMLAGKGVSIAQGVAAGMPGALIAFLAVYVDTMALFIIYPVLIFSYEHFVHAPLYQRHMKRVFDSAQKGIGRVGRFKIAGLFAFVWFPFWMTGVVVGAVLGFLMGMRTWIIMCTVILGTTSAVLCWVYAYDALFGWISVVDERIVKTAIVAILAMALVARLVRKKRPARP